MEFYCYSPSETFVVLTADQFVGRDDGLLQQQRQDSHVCQNIEKLSGPKRSIKITDHFTCTSANVIYSIALRTGVTFYGTIKKFVSTILQSSTKISLILV